MTTSHTVVRPGRRHAPGVRPSRPAVNQRHSYNRSHRPASSKGKTEITFEEDDTDDAMANTFLQYCAVCDKQIVAPGGSVLYCSESCRQRDANNAPSYSMFKSDSIPPAFAKSSNVTSPQVPDIIPQLSPTLTNRPSLSRTQSSTDCSDSESISTSWRGRSHRPSTSRTDSEAAHYLGQFQSGDRPTSRPRYCRSSGTTTPMLSTTPTSTASASIPYTPASSGSAAYPPLPLRNPRWSHASFSNRSVDLITPITQYPTAPSSLTTVTDQIARASIDDRSSTPTLAVSPPGEHELSYERKPLSGSTMSPGHSSLKQLFRFDEMRSKPKSDDNNCDEIAR